MTKRKVTYPQQARTFTIVWTESAWEEYLYWQGEDPGIVARINQLLEECKQHPFTGSGRPERLRHNLNGYWSRRITIEHRLVYLAAENSIYIVGCRHHY